MSRHLERAFKSKNINFYPVHGTGNGTVAELAVRVREFLDRHPVWQDPRIPVHIFGHSAGGLVARLVAAQTGIPEGKILSVLTAAAPNQGSAFAKHCLSIPAKYPGSARMLRSFGYSINDKHGFFADLLPESILPLMREHARIPVAIRQASVICHAPRGEWCWPLRLFYKVPAFNQRLGVARGLQGLRQNDIVERIIFKAGQT